MRRQYFRFVAIGLTSLLIGCGEGHGGGVGIDPASNEFLSPTDDQPMPSELTSENSIKFATIQPAGLVRMQSVDFVLLGELPNIAMNNAQSESARLVAQQIRVVTESR